MINGKPYFDKNGEPIHAHGGWMLHHNGWWYWYGEDRRGERYVSCYRCRNLSSNCAQKCTSNENDFTQSDWEFCAVSLSVTSPVKALPGRGATLFTEEENGGRHKVNIERPKVFYHEKSRKFILWAHYENGQDYTKACACVAVSDTPDGEFTYLGSFNPCGCMSRDCTIFTDDDGAVYFLSAAHDNRDLHVYRLTDDGLDIAEQVNTLHVDQYREAPAVFKRNGQYYLITSGCTGWAPNQGGWSVSSSMTGEWSPLHDFGDETTYRSQSAFVLPLADGETGQMKYYYIGDRWGGGGLNYFNSTYVVLEIQFSKDGAPFIDFTEIAPIL